LHVETKENITLQIQLKAIDTFKVKNKSLLR